MIAKCVGDECTCRNICSVGVPKVECAGSTVENRLHGVPNPAGPIGANNRSQTILAVGNKYYNTYHLTIMCRLELEVPTTLTPYVPLLPVPSRVRVPLILGVGRVTTTLML